MLYIYFAVAGLLLVGGIIAYALSSAWAAMSTVMKVIDPTLVTNNSMVFLDAVWVWMVLAIIVAALIYEVVNTQKEARYV